MKTGPKSQKMKGGMMPGMGMGGMGMGMGMGRGMGMGMGGMGMMPGMGKMAKKVEEPGFDDKKLKRQICVTSYFIYQ